ncbi:hypothetical protein CWC22_007285 [Pseudoalteromonas rubra]|uniref:KAP NTPase domain-containing protein n=1 Tax=Pseudoalteromonas rubra TaxID=43658 RepID=A0A5S3UT79_9GAMM|nr:P-loop NTPase fold protein [Pseudoalteromonas rubra]QPB82810.1 hypothetical protein CWC22_007285 [Pseudoalteromonas rubra]
MAAWQDDKLNRKDEAKFLTDFLINRYATKKDSFVLNIDAEWGFGKTYFLTNWKKQLEAESRCRVVYVNAWESDFSKNPLISFIAAVEGQLSDLIRMPGGEISSSWRDTLYNVGAITCASVVKKLTGLTYDQLTEVIYEDPEKQDEEIDSKQNPHNTTNAENDGNDKKSNSELVSKTAESVTNKLAQNLIAEQKKVESCIKDFVRNIENLAKEASSSFDTQKKAIQEPKNEKKPRENKSENVPLFIFVDELDRCRPQYAIELLEVIKHLFSARGVYFVVTTASDQLSESIKAVYGSGFNAKRYLSRFFTQTYTFIEPNLSDFAYYLLTKEETPVNGTRTLYPKENDIGSVKTKAYLFAQTAKGLGAGLRDMEQAFSLIESVTLANRTRAAELTFVPLAFLALLKITKPDEYGELLSHFNANYHTESPSPKMERIKETLNNDNMMIPTWNGRGPEQNTFGEVMEILSASNKGRSHYITHRDNQRISDSYKHDLSNHLGLIDIHEYPKMIETAGRLLPISK